MAWSTGSRFSLQPSRPNCSTLLSPSRPDIPQHGFDCLPGSPQPGSDSLNAPGLGFPVLSRSSQTQAASVFLLAPPLAGFRFPLLSSLPRFPITFSAWALVHAKTSRSHKTITRLFHVLRTASGNLPRRTKDQPTRNSQEFWGRDVAFAAVVLCRARKPGHFFCVGLHFPQAPGPRMDFDFWFRFRYLRGYWVMPVLQEKPPEVEESVST
ncbi:uncharacterized protein LOC122207718 [Panthera leo]|uniref:uncharacterized protein LOC122207718 n=1 Tax=Panthera leo TaxID=9689 RepID=UPI001C6A5D8B|nr:uncharacterized protein LOC122207718 [Panthera leo]